MRVDLVGDEEVLVGIGAERDLGGSHLVGAERRAVGLGRVDQMRSAVGDVRADDDRATAARRSALGGLDRPVELVEVVGVLDPLHVPALRLEPAAGIVGAEGDARWLPSIVIRFAS